LNNTEGKKNVKNTRLSTTHNKVNLKQLYMQHRTRYVRYSFLLRHSDEMRVLCNSRSNTGYVRAAAKRHFSYNTRVTPKCAYYFIPQDRSQNKCMHLWETWSLKLSWRPVRSTKKSRRYASKNSNLRDRIPLHHLCGSNRGSRRFCKFFCRSGKLRSFYVRSRKVYHSFFMTPEAAQDKTYIEATP